MALFMQKMLNSAVQIVLFTLIPFVWWCITARKKTGFFQFLHGFARRGHFNVGVRSGRKFVQKLARVKNAVKKFFGDYFLFAEIFARSVQLQYGFDKLASGVVRSYFHENLLYSTLLFPRL